MRDFKGQIPSTAAGLVKLPGIGPYMSGAIASIAFGEKVPAVDGNVQRVLSRVFAIHSPPAAKATQNALFALADELVPADRPGDFNQVRFRLESDLPSVARRLTSASMVAGSSHLHRLSWT